jgi:CRISPR/Cas system-associated endoribonuclease Cas2
VHFVVAYDVVKDRRRECDLSAARLVELRERLRTLIDPRRDRVHVYPLCDACFFRSESLGLEGKRLPDRL